MSNYVKSTDFAAKDALASGNSGKIVKGTEIDTEFNNIATAVATKADTASPTFTGTVTLPTGGVTLPNGSVATTQSYGDSTTKVATTAFVQAALQALYPVGSIYINSSDSTNPGTLFGFGTWTAFGAGRVMVGLDAGNAAFDTAEETGGSADAIVVSHSHSVTGSTDTAGSHTHQRYLLSSYSGGSQGYGDFGTDSGSQTNSAGAHSHTVTGTAATTGSSGTNANLQPYIVVRMWKRTA